jgi:hypothetical protein
MGHHSILGISMDEAKKIPLPPHISLYRETNIGKQGTI